LINPNDFMIEEEEKESNGGHCNCQPKVLCVDDNVFNIEILGAILQSQHNITADFAENGIEAMKLFEAGFNKQCNCENRAYKLVLMDLEMP